LNEKTLWSLQLRDSCRITLHSLLILVVRPETKSAAKVDIKAETANTIAKSFLFYFNKRLRNDYFNFIIKPEL